MLLEAQTILVPSVRDGTITREAVPNPAGGMGGRLVGQTALLDLPFREIWNVDFEFISRGGDNPVPVCLVAWELRSGRKIRMWCDEFGSTPPYPTGPDVLFIAFYASAEIGCHRFSDGRCRRASSTSSPSSETTRTACRLRPATASSGTAHFGIDSIGAEEKDEMRALVLRGGPWTEAEKTAILDYCVSDVAALARLLPRLLPRYAAYSGAGGTMDI